MKTAIFSCAGVSLFLSALCVLVCHEDGVGTRFYIAFWSLLILAKLEVSNG